MDDSRSRLDTSETSCSLKVFLSGSRTATTIQQSWISVCHETPYQRQLSSLWSHTLYSDVVEGCLDVCCELEEGRCSRVSGSEAVLIFSW